MKGASSDPLLNLSKGPAVKPFHRMTRSTQRMIVGSLVGKTASLRMLNGKEFQLVEPRGLATKPGGYKGDNPVFQSHMVFADYFSGDLYVIGLWEIDRLEAKERPITDPQHPDYEDPGRIVRPAKRR